jgi:uncharacterized membrane protein YraQ (UPF0718 family)
MSSTLAVKPAVRAERSPVVGLVGFLLLASLLLTWAKWSPYAHKLEHLSVSGSWTGKDILAKAGPAGSAPSLSGAWSFTHAYFIAVLPAAVAGLLIAASVPALVPGRLLRSALVRSSRWRSALAGGMLAIPTLMCTCCAAPVAATLRRQGAAISAVLAYWTGNPTLNPAVLAFLALVAPWQWVVTRGIVGLVLVFAVTPLVARLAPRGTEQAAAAPARAADRPIRYAPVTFGRNLAVLAVRLLPEYLLVVFLVGLFRGWVFPIAHGSDAWLAPTLIAAALGTLVVIPTAGEIPILQGLAAAGASTGVVGALLIALPAISIVSMAMMARELPLRVVLGAAGAVAGCSLLAAGLLSVLG